MVAALVSLLLAGQPASGDGLSVLTGAGLLERCERGDDRSDAGCLHYVGGAVDGIAAYEALLRVVSAHERQSAKKDGREEFPTLKPTICIPSDATYGQHVRIVTKFLRDHPQRLHERRFDLVMAAMAEAFPCATSE
jgi:Ssp1 endopeptidase immunity protein Rap1a